MGNKAAKSERKNMNNFERFVSLKHILNIFFRNRNCNHVIYNLQNIGIFIMRLIGAENRYLYYVKSKLHNLAFLLKAITVSIRGNLRTKLSIELTGVSFSLSLFLFLSFADHFSTNGRGTKPFNTEVSGQIQFVMNTVFLFFFLERFDCDRKSNR